MAQSAGAVNNPRFILQISKGLVRDHRARRMLMFYNVLVVLVLIFLGSTLLWSWLRGHPFFFIAYWGLCAWLTLLAVLLALYDMAKVRLEAQRARRQLEEQYLAETKNDSSDDSHAR